MSAPALHVVRSCRSPSKLSLAEAFLDNFGSDHVLDSSADDLKDHWTHDDHEGERLRLLETLFATAKAKQLRVAIISGDVHVAAHKPADDAFQDNWAQIQQFTSTAVVHPSLVSVAERLFFHVLDNVGRITQNLTVNTSAEMLIFPAVEPAGHGCAELAGDRVGILEPT